MVLGTVLALYDKPLLVDLAEPPPLALWFSLIREAESARLARRATTSPVSGTVALGFAE